MPKREKLDLVIRIRKGKSQCKVSQEMRVPESTLRGWLKDEVKLREFLINVCAASILILIRTCSAARLQVIVFDEHYSQ